MSDQQVSVTRPRVLILGVKYFPAKGGTSRVVENLFLELHNQVDFTILCYKDKSSAAHIANVETIQLSEIKIKGFGVFLYYLRCCVHLCFNHDYDVIHIHKTDAAFMYKVAKLFCPTVFTSHALPQLNDKWSNLGKTYFRYMERLIMGSSIKKTCISKVQQQYFLDKYGAQVQYIPNGIHPPKGLMQDNIPGLVSIPIDLNAPYIFFAARRIIPLKGLHTMIKSLQQIKYKHPIVIAGDCDQLPKYTSELKNIDKDLNLIFLGYISDMSIVNNLIKHASLFIFPSELEGMSMMLLEAGLIGTPIVCSDIAANTAILDSSEVIYFKSKDVDDLANKITWALTKTDEAKKIATNAQTSISSRYSMEKIAQSYKALYESMIAK